MAVTWWQRGTGVVEPGRGDECLLAAPCHTLSSRLALTAASTALCGEPGRSLGPLAGTQAHGLHFAAHDNHAILVATQVSR